MPTKDVSKAAQARPRAATTGDNTNSLLRRKVEDTETLLGISRSQLAQALLVERATVYQWFRGAQPRQKTAQRLDSLLAIAKAWHDSNIGSARAAWNLHLKGADRSLGELLSSDPLEAHQLHRLIQSTPQGKEPELVSPASELEGFPAQTALEERRRRRRIFPPTYFSGD
jgi:transcriptional regulator with XRE-family HTH domain